MSANRIVETAANMSFGGWHKQFSHRSAVLDCDMNFALYLPPQVEQGETVPVLYWLSGLTCNHENFMQKAGAQKLAAELGIAIVAPDTSPRGEGVADDEAWDLGQGAGFYLNATEAPWKAHYQMYDYIVHELPALLEAQFPVSQKRAISGHSMGGHGALTIALKNPDRFSSVSAFCPIANPIQCPWGQKAFSAYLGVDTDSWRAYDTVALLSDATASLPALVDQGQADQFLQEQLGIDALAAAAAKASYPLTLQRHEHYDHSYYFVASFVEAHLQFHARHLKA